MTYSSMIDSATPCNERITVKQLLKVSLLLFGCFLFIQNFIKISNFDCRQNQKYKRFSYGIILGLCYSLSNKSAATVCDRCV